MNFKENQTSFEKIKKLQSLYIKTPIGIMYALADEKFLYFLEFIDQKDFKKGVKDFIKKQKVVVLFEKNTLLERTKKELGEYFVGKRFKFSLPLAIIGTNFQKDVWKIIEKIPYGKTFSYHNEAQFLGKPKAVRSVASANGKNHIALVIPCHRVIRSDGSLGGYAGGIARKKWLLEHEKKYSSLNT